MKGVPISAGRDLAVTAVFTDAWADYSILLLMSLVCALFLAERKSGLWPMIYAAPGGRKRLAVRRVVLLFPATLGLYRSLLPAAALYPHRSNRRRRSSRLLVPTNKVLPSLTAPMPYPLRYGVHEERSLLASWFCVVA